MTDDTQKKNDEIARKLLARILKRVSWSDCKVHRGHEDFTQEIQEAAEEVKRLGEGWEEWT